MLVPMYKRKGYEAHCTMWNHCTALYEVRDLTTPGRFIYEVVLLKGLRAAVFHGTECPEHWGYPSTEEFGTRGWTYSTEIAAIQKFTELVDSKRGKLIYEKAVENIPSLAFTGDLIGAI